jgi:hypothetical protein
MGCNTAINLAKYSFNIIFTYHSAGFLIREIEAMGRKAAASHLDKPVLAIY